MNWLISIWIVFSFNYSVACSISPQAEIISLSNPISFLLSKLDLIKSNQLKGISEYHYYSKEDFKGKVYKGGIFLSQKELKNFIHKVVFFDKSRDLKKSFEKFKLKKVIEFDSRSKDPWQVYQESVDLLSPYLKNCRKSLARLDRETNSIKSEILRKKDLRKRVFFFLGKIKRDKINQMMMLQDGFVKWLIEEKVILSYPSELAYFIPSQRILRKYPKALNIGLVADRDNHFIKVQLKKLRYNIRSSLVFSAGLGQIYFLKDLMGFINNSRFL